MTNQFSNSNDQRLTLVIDSALEEASVSLVEKGEVVGEKKWENGPGVGTRLLKEIDGLLDEKKLKIEDIEAVAVNVAAKKWFSSARAGVAVANGLVVATGVAVMEMGSDEAKEFLVPKYD